MYRFVLVLILISNFSHSQKKMKIPPYLKKGDTVTLIGFGTFKVSKRAARIGRNPQTGKELKIPARKAPTFKAGTALKAAVN